MHREEIEVSTDKCQDKVELAQTFVVHTARHFREPVVESGIDAHHRGSVNHIVKMTDNKISVVDMDIDGYRCQHNPSDTGKDKHN